MSSTPLGAPLVGMALVLNVASPALAQEASDASARNDAAKLTGYAEVLAASAYVWRGALYTGDRFEPNFQPSAELTVNELGPGWLTAGVWGLVPTVGSAYEIDPLLKYGVSAGKWLDLEGGYTIFVTLDPWDDYQHEVLLDLTLTGGLPVNPIVGVAVDPVRTHGAYAYAGLSAEFEGETLGLAAELSAGVSGYEGVDPGFNDVTATVIGSYYPVSVLYTSLVAGVGYDARAEAVNPWGGLAIGVAF